MSLQDKDRLLHRNIALNRWLVRLAVKLRVVRFVLLQDVVDGSQQHPGDGDNRFLVSAPLFNGVIAVGDFRVLLAADRVQSALHEQRLEVNPGTGNARGLLFSRALVVLRSEAGPRAKVS